MEEILANRTFPLFAIIFHMNLDQFAGSFEPTTLVGGFNPFEKYQSNWIIPPGGDENTTYLKPPPSNSITGFCHLKLHPALEPSSCA